MDRLYRRVLRAAAALGLAGAFVLVVAAPAHAAAANLDVDGSTIYYTAGAGQPNHLIIERSGDTYLFQEVGGQTISSTDRACYYTTPGNYTAMSCLAAGLYAIVVYGNDLDDAIHNWTDRSVALLGGDGNDWLGIGGHAGDTSYANGGNGDDVLISGPGSDTMIGGVGRDTVSYSGSAVAVQASLVTNTGSRPNETDFYNSIENLEGGGGNDFLYGGDSPNDLDGGDMTICLPWGCFEVSGNDSLYGNGGDDTLNGDEGADTLSGGSGNDTLWGENGDDWLYGDAGNDTLHDGPGYDYSNGGAGYDLCWAEVRSQCEN